MRLLLAAALVGLLAPSIVEAGPFGPGRSEGRPTAKKAKPAKKKPAKKPVVDEDDEDDAEIVIEETPPKKVAAKKPAKPTKPAAVEADEEDDDDKPVAKVAAKQVPKVVAKPKPAPVEDDEETVIIEEPEARVATKPAPRKPMVGAKPVVADEEDDEDDEDATTETDGEKRVATSEDDGEVVVDTPAVTKAAAPKATPHKTRFYFRAGFMRQSTKLGATEFSLETDLPVDSGSLGEGSGVETQQDQVPFGGLVGVVLPVLDRKLSVEVVVGIPSPTKFKATGKLANESLAPTFMGMDTGIEALGPDLGEVTFSPPVVTGVYRIAKLGPVTPIAGAGLMILLARGAKITNAVLDEAGDPKLKISPSPGLVLQGGLDIALWKRVAARIDVKYVLGMKVNATIEDIAVTPKAIPTLGSIEVGDAVMSAKVAPLIIQAGVGVDF